jgi:hypothetical protein
MMTPNSILGPSDPPPKKHARHFSAVSQLKPVSSTALNTRPMSPASTNTRTPGI